MIFVEETLALGGWDQLGVADAGDVAVGVEHDGRRDHRTGQATASDFVDTRNVANPPRRSAFSSVRKAVTRAMLVRRWSDLESASGRALSAP